MNYSVPSYLAPIVLVGAVTVTAALIFGLRRALRLAGWRDRERTQTVWSVSAIVVGWFVFALATSLASWYGGVARKAPTIQYGVFVPILVGAFLFWSWPLLRSALAAIPRQWFIGIQFYRVLGLVFLFMYAGGYLPGLFAIPAGVGDVLVGLWAPSVAAAYARSPKSAENRVRVWNYLGIADLVIALTLGFVTAPSPFQLAAFDRPNALIGIFPLVLIPVYLVPIAILLHFASLWRLREVETRSVGRIGALGGNEI